LVSIAREESRRYLSTVGVIVHNQYERTEAVRSTHPTDFIHVTAWLCPAFFQEDSRKVSGNVVDETGLELIEGNALDRAGRLLLYSNAQPETSTQAEDSERHSIRITESDCAV